VLSTLKQKNEIPRFSRNKLRNVNKRLLHSLRNDEIVLFQQSHKVATEEGSNMIRLGTIVFGERKYEN